MRKLIAGTNVNNDDPTDYPKGYVRDKAGAVPGTIFNEALMGDIFQFFQKLVIDGTISENDIPDNVTNGYQLIEALEKKIVDTLPVADETTLGISERATQAESEGFTDNTRHLTPLRGSQLVEKKYSDWDSVTYNAADYNSWSGSATNFSFKYNKVGTTAFVHARITGNISSAVNTVFYNGVPSALLEASEGALAVTALRANVPKQIAGVRILNGNIYISQDGNFETGDWAFVISGSYETNS